MVMKYSSHITLSVFMPQQDLKQNFNALCLMLNLCGCYLYHHHSSPASSPHSSSLFAPLIPPFPGIPNACWELIFSGQCMSSESIATSKHFIVDTSSTHPWDFVRPVPTNKVHPILNCCQDIELHWLDVCFSPGEFVKFIHWVSH